MPQTPYNTPVGVSYQNIVNAGTTTVKANAGTMFSLNINQGVSGATATIYDNTAASGTKIATIALGVAETTPTNVPFGPAGAGLNFNTGLVIVTTGTVDITVAYR